MTKEEFEKLYLGKAVHCDTEEKANEFLALAHSVGYRWITEGKLINYSRWEMYKKQTCYVVAKYGFMFASVAFLEPYDYQIIEYQSQSGRTSK